jgi:hypothetical protein
MIAIVEVITDIIQFFWNRENHDQFVCRLAQDNYNKWGGRYNVLVYNAYQNGDASGLQGVQAECVAKFPEIWLDSYFIVVVSESGQFVKRGDGGFINWCFINDGRSQRVDLPGEGSRVQFWSHTTCGGDTFCFEDRQCRNLQFDPSNCGTCGRRCPASTRCTNGQCGEVPSRTLYNIYYNHLSA